MLVNQDKRYHTEWFDIPFYNEIPDIRSFSIRHLQYSEPFVCRNCLKDWNAIKEWQNDQYLLDQIGENIIQVEKRIDGQTTFAYFQKEYMETDMKYSEFLQLYDKFEGNDRYYYANQDIPHQLKNDVKEPFLGQIMDLDKVNIWQSAGGTISLPHTDAFDNFLCQVTGYKDIILIPPTQRKYLELQEGVSNYSPINFFEPDYNLHPDFKNVKGKMKVRLEPGDFLFIPAFWWHHVISSKEKSIAINYWYIPNFMTQIFIGGLESQQV